MEVGSQSRWLEAAIQDTTFATAAPATALTGSIGVGDGLDDLQLDDWMRDISTSATAAASSQPRQATSGSKASSTEAYALFDALRDSIYSEVATVISLHEHRPHFLVSCCCCCLKSFILTMACGQYEKNNYRHGDRIQIDQGLATFCCCCCCCCCCSRRHCRCLYFLSGLGKQA